MSGRIPAAGRLAALLDGFAGRPVVVYGDLVLDEFILGRIDRVSREAPVLILEHQRVERVPGGGANAAANLTALGARVQAVGLVGDDEAGGALLDLLASRGVDVTGVRRAPGWVTPTKTRILAGSTTSVRQQVVRIDRGVGVAAPEPLARRLAEEAAARAVEAQAVLVADYGHGALDDAARRSLARRPGQVLTVDSRRRLPAFRGMTAATPNLEEAAGALGEAIPDEDAAVGDAAVRLRQRLSADALVVTRGSRGMTVADVDGGIHHLPVFGTDEVADVTGAGDTVIASLTLALAGGAGILEAAQLATVAAGLAVMKRGTATVARAEIRTALATGWPP